MALKLGELVTLFTADDSALRQGLSSARTQVSRYADTMKQTLAAGGALAGGLAAKGITDNLDISAGRAKLRGQLDLSAEDSRKAATVAGKVYAAGWGTSLDDINGAIRAVAVNLGGVSRMSEADLQKVTTGAMALADTFDLDVNDAARAAGKMISTGLAKNATDAMDIITRGFQTGADSSGDFLDTLNEYSPQFAKLGIGGDRVLTILSKGLKAGARDTDAVADAFKEFGIRAIDGSKTTADGFKALGLDAKKASKAIAAGGPAAAQMTQTVIEKLAAMKNPLKQNAAGTALFGTQWEDTVRKIVPSLARAEEGMEGVDGATARLEDQTTSGKTKIEQIKRGFEQWTQGMTNSDSALGTMASSVMAFGGPVLAGAGSVGALVTGLAALNVQAAAGAVKAAALATAHGVSAVASKLFGSACLWTRIQLAALAIWQRAVTIAQWAMNSAFLANPLTWIVVAVIALVAAFIYAWKNSETFRNIIIGTWNVIKATAIAVWGWLKSFISGTWKAISTVGKLIWAGIKLYVTTYIKGILLVVRGVLAVVGFFRDAWNRAKSAVVSVTGALLSYIKGIPGRIKANLGNLGNLLYSAGQAIIRGLVRGIESMAGAAANAAKKVVSKISSFLPGSPVKEGPLRVLNRGYAGRQIVKMVADGMTADRPALGLAMGRTVSDAATRAVGRGYSGSAARAGAVPVVLEFVGADDAMTRALRKIVRVKGGGSVQTAFGGAA